MAIKLKQDYHRILYFQQEVDRLFRYLFEDEEVSTRSGALYPLADVFETNDMIYIEIDLPGLKKEDIDAYITRDMVIVEGIKKERDLEVQGVKERYLCLERVFGQFRRVIEIPTAVDTSRIKAVLKDGVLRLALPKIVDRREKKKRILIEEE